MTILAFYRSLGPECSLIGSRAATDRFYVADLFLIPQIHLPSYSGVWKTKTPYYFSKTSKLEKKDPTWYVCFGGEYSSPQFSLAKDHLLLREEQGRPFL